MRLLIFKINPLLSDKDGSGFFLKPYEIHIRMHRVCITTFSGEIFLGCY